MQTIIGNPCVHVGASLSPDDLFFIGYVLTITDRKSPLPQLLSLMYRSLLSQFIKFNLRLLLLRQIPPLCRCYSFGTSKVGSCISNIDPGSFHFLKVSLWERGLGWIACFLQRQIANIFSFYLYGWASVMITFKAIFTGAWVGGNNLNFILCQNSWVNFQSMVDRFRMNKLGSGCSLGIDNLKIDCLACARSFVASPAPHN